MKQIYVITITSCLDYDLNKIDVVNCINKATLIVRSHSMVLCTACRLNDYDYDYDYDYDCDTGLRLRSLYTRSITYI